MDPSDFRRHRVAVVVGHYPTPVLSRLLTEMMVRANQIAESAVFVFVYWWKDIPRPPIVEDLIRCGLPVREFALLGPIRQGFRYGWLHSYSEWGAHNLATFRELRQFFAEQRFTAVFTMHIPWYSELMVALCARTAMIPFVIKFFTSTQLPLQWHRWLAHFLIARLLSRIVVITPEAKRFALLAGFITERYSVIRSVGVVGRQFAPEDAHPSAVREKYGIPESAPVISIIARIDPVKGHEDFLRAVAILRREFRDIRALVVGSQFDPAEPYEPRLRKLCDELGIADAVIFTGMQWDVEHFYAASDVVVHPAHYDLFPFTVLEASSMERAIVATRVGGIPEIIKEGLTGILVPPRDPLAIATAVGKLLRDPDLRAKLGKTARQFVLTRWTFDRAWNDTLRFLRDMLNGTPRPEYPLVTNLNNYTPPS
ncbi:MAG: glycosyltransferase family 4 protein [bacterium JZ-2024 1]